MLAGLSCRVKKSLSYATTSASIADLSSAASASAPTNASRHQSRQEHFHPDALPVSTSPRTASRQHSAMTAGGHKFGAHCPSGTEFTLPAPGPVATERSLTLAVERDMSPKLAGCRIAASTGLVNLSVGHLPTKAPTTSTAKCEACSASCMQETLVLRQVVRKKCEMSSWRPAHRRTPFRMRQRPLPEGGASCELDR